MTLGVSGPAGLDSQLRDYLRPGEELIWLGAPARSFTLTPADGYLIPFSIVWLAFASFWEAGVTTRTGSVLGEIWGVPFIALGLYMLAGRFLVKRYQHRHTAYGVTRDRAMIVTPRSFRDLPLRDVPMTSRYSRRGRVSVIASTPEPDRPYSFLGRRRPTQAASSRYANTGMEPLMRSAQFPFAFYDVEDSQGLLAALDRARTPGSW
jgi:hypothetical protein